MAQSRGQQRGGRVGAWRHLWAQGASPWGQFAPSLKGAVLTPLQALPEHVRIPGGGLVPASLISKSRGRRPGTQAWSSIPLTRRRGHQLASPPPAGPLGGMLPLLSAGEKAPEMWLHWGVG